MLVWAYVLLLVILWLAPVLAGFACGAREFKGYMLLNTVGMVLACIAGWLGAFLFGRGAPIREAGLPFSSPWFIWFFAMFMSAAVILAVSGSFLWIVIASFKDWLNNRRLSVNHQGVIDMHEQNGTFVPVERIKRHDSWHSRFIEHLKYSFVENAVWTIGLILGKKIMTKLRGR